MGIRLLCPLLTSAQSPTELPPSALSVSTSFARNRRWQRLRPGLIDQWPDWELTDRSLSRSRCVGPPQIRACTVTAQLHHLRWPLDHAASSSYANSPPAYPVKSASGLDDIAQPTTRRANRSRTTAK